MIGPDRQVQKSRDPIEVGEEELLGGLMREFRGGAPKAEVVDHRVVEIPAQQPQQQQRRGMSPREHVGAFRERALPPRRDEPRFPGAAPQPVAQPRQSRHRDVADVPPADFSIVRVLALIFICGMGLKIMLQDAYWSVSAYARMGWLSENWNAVPGWPLLWGLLGTWNWNLLWQVPTSFIQLSIMPWKWIGFNGKRGVQFPIIWAVSSENWGIPGVWALLIFSVAFITNVGTNYIGVSAEMQTWRPLYIFAELPWPKEGGAHIFIVLVISCFVGLVGERIIATSFRGIVAAFRK